jgi:hypothetical protein
VILAKVEERYNLQGTLIMTEYKGQPFKDSVYPGDPQAILGRILCAYYDFGGEGVAYHDTDPVNHGSGELNLADGSYIHEFRKDEGVDTSYFKSNGIDDHSFNFVDPKMGQLYVGWTDPGEWIKYTVDVNQTGAYMVSLFYTSNRGGEISISVNDKDAAGLISIKSTYRAEDPSNGDNGITGVR